MPFGEKSVRWLGAVPTGLRTDEEEGVECVRIGGKANALRCILSLQPPNNHPGGFNITGSIFLACIFLVISTLRLTIHFRVNVTPWTMCVAT